MHTRIREGTSNFISKYDMMLPTLPVIIHNMLNVMREETASSKDLVRIIRKDPAIAARILKLANSAYYGRSQQVDTLYRAIMMLGFNEVAVLAIGMSTFSDSQREGDGGPLSMNGLWAHSIGVSMACKGVLRTLATRTPGGVVSRRELPVLMAALLHDVGKIVYTLRFPEEYACLLDRAREENIPLEPLEEEAFGMDHARLAGALMDRWNFPASIVFPVYHHHNPAGCRPSHVWHARVLAVSNYLAHCAGAGESGGPAPVYPSTSLEALGLDAGDVPALIENVKKGLLDITRFLTVI